MQPAAAEWVSSALGGLHPPYELPGSLLVLIAIGLLLRRGLRADR